MMKNNVPTNNQKNSGEAGVDFLQAIIEGLIASCVKTVEFYEERDRDFEKEFFSGYLRSFKELLSMTEPTASHHK